MKAPSTVMRAPLSVAGHTAVVLGYGKSGRAAASLLDFQGATVRVSDSSPLSKLDVRASSVPGGPKWIGGEKVEVLDGADFLVVSPGVPPSNAIVRAALQRGLRVISELELGWSFTSGAVVAITGTNGKTTTTELCGAIGRAAGRETIVAGNVGTPITSFAGKHADLVVLEVSSFQLQFSRTFRPEVGTLLNLTEDHLDWHPDFEDYARAKRRMFEAQLATDAVCLSNDDPEIARRFTKLPARVFKFGETALKGHGATIQGGDIVVNVEGKNERILSLSEWSLPGRHNRENLLAACLSMRLVGIPAATIAKACREFQGMPHRMEVIAVVDGVTYVNDSKSTNPGSLEKALDPEVPTLLIAGGVTKGCDFRPLADLVARATRHVFVIGSGADDMISAWGETAQVVRAGTLKEAVRLARETAKPGDRVLLSPGCASFDQFKNYAHRGDSFRELVLAKGVQSGGDGS